MSDQGQMFKMERDKRTIRTKHEGLHPIDLIFTYDSPFHLPSHIAHDAGCLIGIRSGRWRYAMTEHRRPQWESRFKILFVDNEWHDYDHEVHMRAIREIQPKYATVRDYVTKEDADREKIPFYTFDEVLDMADEVAKYAQNAIVIPKVDVIDSIPERHMLGYSVPSSYGQTHIPVDRFRGRRVHLLGGSWESQRTLVRALGYDVVSIDLNHPVLIAKFGQFVTPDGKCVDLGETLRYSPFNQLACCLALSLGNIASGVRHEEALRSNGRKESSGTA